MLTTKRLRTVALTAMLLVGVAPVMAQNATTGIGPLALAKLQTSSSATIVVSSSDIVAGAPIPQIHSSYADSVSPSLRWAPVAKAASYVVLMEDPDTRPTAPTVHWVVYNIVPTMTSLPQGITAAGQPGAFVQGKNGKGAIGYRGPHPPAGDPPHHYHIQVLALDRMLGAPADATRDEVIAAAQGHVLAAGELVATYQAPAAAR